MSDEQRASIWSAIDANLAAIALPKVGGPRPAFIWPLRSARGYSAPGFHVITNFVDQDLDYPDKKKDYNCGARTYDRSTGNHRGTDIAVYPDSWNVTDERQVEVVSAAAGTIVQKSEGNEDRFCANGSGRTWNAVYVMHDDGSTAWYGHLKLGTVTTKAIGERVVAGEYLGVVGSSGDSSGPHLHLEVYDAARALVDPFQGPCNSMNADSWWASQPAYRDTRVLSAITASAVPVARTCGSDSRLTDPGTINLKSAFAPGDTVYLVSFVRDMPKGESLQITVRRPDATIWRTATSSAASDDFTSSYWWFSRTLEANAPAGTWMFEATLAGTSAQYPFAVTPDGSAPSDYTDIWWNPTEPGWGVNVNHQGDTLFATWFTYDADGSGMWLVMPDTRRQPDGSYSGTVYRTTGTPLSQINGQAAAHFPASTVGSGTFRFAANAAGTFSYVVNGVSQSKGIQRQVFSVPAKCVATAGSRRSLTNYQDLWWNASEPGWGINLAHQGDTLFATWFTYGSGGRGQWLVVAQAQRQPTGEFRGRLYRTTGRPLASIAGEQASLTTTDVGEITFTFADGESARMDYRVDGVSQSKSITREAFGSTFPLCR
jgi:hypothetical protein